MKHLPYSEWLFEPQILTDEERDVLEEHLGVCDHCRTLSSTWREVESVISKSEPVAPTPGFLRRWQAALTERRQARRRRQVWVFLGGLLSAGLAVCGLLGIDVWSKIASPAELVYGWSQSIQILMSQLAGVQDFLFEATHITQEVPVLVWIALLVTVLWLSWLWGAVVYRFATQLTRNGV